MEPDVRLELLQLLYKRRKAFARSLADLGQYNKQTFDIPLTDNKPMFQKQFRLTPESAKVAQQHIDNWVKHGILSESKQYLWNQPYFLVRKKTDDLDKSRSSANENDPKIKKNLNHHRDKQPLTIDNTRLVGLENS